MTFRRSLNLIIIPTLSSRSRNRPGRLVKPQLP